MGAKSSRVTVANFGASPHSVDESPIKEVIIHAPRTPKKPRKPLTLNSKKRTAIDSFKEHGFFNSPKHSPSGVETKKAVLPQSVFLGTDEPISARPAGFCKANQPRAGMPLPHDYVFLTVEERVLLEERTYMWIDPSVFENHLYEMFRHYDVEGSGYLGFDEVRRLTMDAVEWFIQWHETELEKSHRDMPVEDLHDLCLNDLPYLLPGETREEIVANVQTCLVLEMDLNGDGFISEGEFYVRWPAAHYKLLGEGNPRTQSELGSLRCAVM